MILAISFRSLLPPYFSALVRSPEFYIDTDFWINWVKISAYCRFTNNHIWDGVSQGSFSYHLSRNSCPILYCRLYYPPPITSWLICRCLILPRTPSSWLLAWHCQWHHLLVISSHWYLSDYLFSTDPVSRHNPWNILLARRPKRCLRSIYWRTPRSEDNRVLALVVVHFMVTNRLVRL